MTSNTTSFIDDLDEYIEEREYVDITPIIEKLKSKNRDFRRAIEKIENGEIDEGIRILRSLGYKDENIAAIISTIHKKPFIQALKEVKTTRFEFPKLVWSADLVNQIIFISGLRVSGNVETSSVPVEMNAYIRKRKTIRTLENIGESSSIFNTVKSFSSAG